jgi:hypothetical protein
MKTKSKSNQSKLWLQAWQCQASRRKKSRGQQDFFGDASEASEQKDASCQMPEMPEARY